MTGLPERVVAIHQPNFLPWLGFFNKIALADVFVLLDDAQFPKTGGTWTNRAKVIVGDAPRWLTVPVRRDYHGVKRINEIQIDDSKPWRDHVCKTLRASYGRTPYFSPTMELLSDVLSYRGGLAEFNERGVRAILEYVGCRRGTILRASELEQAGRATDRLIAISKAVGATTYLCGGGAADYQDDAAFSRDGIELRYQGFQHPLYPQTRRPQFHEGLSIVDALFELGPSATASLITSSPQ